MNNITTTTLRINTILYEKICKEAIKDNRSINAEICFILLKYLESMKWNK
jgi:hypothetical protein